MNFELTDGQRELEDLMRRFVAKEMSKEAVAAWDVTGEFPVKLLNHMVEIGLMGALIPTEYSGTGGGVMEEVPSRRSSRDTARPLPLLTSVTDWSCNCN